MKVLKFPAVTALEGLPWMVRALLGCCAAGIAAGLTYSLEPLRAFPLLLAFPAVILSSWFLGMWGGVSCALTEASLVDSYLTRSQFRFSVGSAPQELRLAVFLTISILLGYTIRRLAQQRAQIAMEGLRGRLSLANAERQLAEERARASEAVQDRDELLQIALQSNGMGLWVWDLQDGTGYWSDEMYRMIGLEPGSIEPSGESWLRYVHSEDVDGVQEAARRIREGVADYHHQYRVVWPDGSVRWLESQSKCQRDSAGRLTRVMGVLSDVTRRKQADEAMLRAEKLAVVGRLAASVAHEINNPLAAVANLLFLVTLADTTETAHAHARQAMDELMRVSLITQQTLKFHRQNGSPKTTKLSELIDAVLTLFRGKLVAAGISVEVRAESEASIACLPSETQQIFANLMSNAVEAMPQGGRLVIRLQSSCDWRNREQAGMRATFCDSGVGMDRVTMRRIFEPFFTTKTETGTGLGMWVVAQLLERQHGHVRVWSTQREGRSGTAFSVFLPSGEISASAAKEEAALQSAL
ncbi:PAS domain-containing protein [Acidicapsa acidisoli]|uniref:PAS domain-containing protein n=1 Tax=Acidicapsa acidisoli TaxID=1615681 RepID=UPI0021DF8BD7|nr:PAS domain-containing protein [Acidicapsa acidisoli]